MIKFNPIGSAYIPLPKYLSSKKAIVNVHNYDERCFGYATISALKDPQPGRHDKSEFGYYSEADFAAYGLDQIQYPVPVQTIPELEETLDISFSIIRFFDDEGSGLYPMFHTKHERARHVDLLDFNEHYAWIKNMDRLVNQLSKNTHKLFFCKNCWSCKTHLESVITRHKQLYSRENWCSVI